MSTHSYWILLYVAQHWHCSLDGRCLDVGYVTCLAIYMYMDVGLGFAEGSQFMCLYIYMYDDTTYYMEKLLCIRLFLYSVC